MRTHIALLALVLTAACDQGEAPTVEDRTADAATAKVSAEVLDATPLMQARKQAQLVAADGMDAQTLARTIEPRRTRAGFLRFTTSAIHDPAFTEVFLERLTAGDESAEVRAALVEALPRTGGDYADALLAMMPDERDANVRVAMVSAFKRAPERVVAPGLELGLEDSDPKVRAEAARIAGSRPEVPLTGALAARTSDRDARVRAAATRSLGLLGASDRVDDVDGRLRDTDPTVRLEAIRALRRLDPEGASGRVATLTGDDHDIVRNAAQRLQK